MAIGMEMREMRGEKKKGDPRKRIDEFGPHVKGIFVLKMSLPFHNMFVLVLCFYYMFEKHEKPNFYFPYYGKHNSPFFVHQ